MAEDRRFRRFKSGPWVLAATLLVLTASGVGIAQDPNACDLPGEAPDLTISNINQVARWGAVDGITAFSLGVDSCNSGSCWVNWLAGSNQHPVFAQNMFRLKGGKFEQIGQSWVSHRFAALSLPGCPGTCVATSGTHLGVGCSTTDSPAFAAGQSQMGPRFEVDASTGFFEFPATDQGVTGNAIYKRLQVHDEDLDPAFNEGALYFVEGAYVAPDDAAAQKHHNNASYRPVDVFGAGGVFDIALIGETRPEHPAILAWQLEDPQVLVQAVDVPGDGRFLVGSKATPIGNGVWHYEFAVLNLNSHRSARRFEVPLGQGAWVTNVGFHDVDYHSGEPFDGTDWTPLVEPASDAVSWTTLSFAQDPNANALRWGTLYNFRFDASAAPVQAKATVGLFRAGAPEQVLVTAVVPGTCNENGTCDSGESVCSCPEDCGVAATFELSCSDQLSNDCDGLVDCLDPDCCSDSACAASDADSDGVPTCEDCDDANAAAWAAPGEVTDLIFSADTLSWTAPTDPGSALVGYETIRSSDPADFISAATCLADAGMDTSVTAGEIPTPGSAFFYLVRADNACPFAQGSLGTGPAGQARPGLTCR